MNDKFEREFKETFESTVPDVLQSIKQSPRFKVPEKPAKRSILEIFKHRGFRFSMTSAFLIVILAVVFMQTSDTTQIYASTVTLEINPQIEILLDEDDLVISVTALNGDGDEVLTDTTFQGMTLDEVIEYLMDRFESLGYIESDVENVIMIYVESDNETIKERVRLKVEERITAEANRIQRVVNFVRSNNYDLTEQEIKRIMDLAKELNINPGRLILIQQIIELNDTYSIPQLNRMSMRELYNLEIELQIEYDERPSDNGNNQGGSL